MASARVRQAACLVFFKEPALLQFVADSTDLDLRNKFAVESGRLRCPLRQPVESVEQRVCYSLGFIAFAGDFGRAFKLPIARMNDNRQKLRSGLWRAQPRLDKFE